MSVLADRDIRVELETGRVKIEPYDPADLQPSSVDLHLDRRFRVFRNNRYPYIDVRAPQPDLTEMLVVEDEEPFILHPGEFVLGQTLEWVELPDDLVARLEGKSSLGRLGLLIETPSGRVVVETGIGERVDEKTRAMRSYEGPWIASVLETVGFVPESVNIVALSHLCLY